MKDTILLRELLEKILFNEKELIKLKESITQLVSGTLSSKEFKEKIIHLRTMLLEDLIKFYPYYLSQSSDKRDQTENPYQQQLSERNSLLDTIGSRLQKLYEKLNP
jgi:hypothetical protein